MIRTPGKSYALDIWMLGLRVGWIEFLSIKFAGDWKFRTAYRGIEVYLKCSTYFSIPPKFTVVNTNFSELAPTVSLFPLLFI